MLDLLRVCVEVLENAVQHSRADRVMIVHSVHEGRLRIEIKDNGVGIPAGVNPNAGSGLEVCADIALQNGWSFNASATLGGSIVSLIV